MNGSSFEPTRIILVAYAWFAFQIRFRYVPNSVNGSVSSRHSDHFGRVCCVVAFQFSFARFEFSFMNGSSFEPILGFWSRMLRGCVPDSVSLRFEFSFMNGSSFEPILGFWSRMLRGCVPDSVSLRFEFSFMNGSSFELCSDHFGVAMLAVRQELESQVQQAH